MCWWMHGRLLISTISIRLSERVQMKYFLSGLIGLLAAAGVQAAPSWIQIAAFDKHLGVDLVEVDSIQRKGNLVTYWRWMVLPKVWGEGAGEPFDNTKSKNVVDCAEKTGGYTYIVSYLGNVSVNEKSVPLVMKPMVPNSVGMDELNAVCTKRLPGKAFDTYDQIKASFPASR